VIGKEAQSKEQPGELRHTIDSSKRIHKFLNSVQLEWKAVFQVLDEQDGEMTDTVRPAQRSAQYHSFSPPSRKL